MARANTRSNDDGARDLVVQPPRLPMPREAQEAGVSPAEWKALVDVVFPSARTVNGVLLAREYCRHRQLDVMKRPVHVVPMWNSALGREVETVWPGINEYRTTASRTGLWAGNDECEFGPLLREGFKVDEQRSKRNGDKYRVQAECPPFDFPEWARVTVYKIMGGQRVPFVGPKVYFKEIFSGEKGVRVPNEKWRTAPRQMLEKCAEAAALRRAFPEELGNVYTAEEMEGKDYAGDPIAATKEILDAEHTDAEPKPKREADKTPWEKIGISEDYWNEIESLQDTIDDPGSTLVGLKSAKTLFTGDYAKGWPPAAIKELELRFDTAIAKIESDAPGGNQGREDGDDEQ